MIKRNAIPLSILAIIAIFILNPALVSEGAFKGLSIWINNIVPFLFPMFILSNILLQYNFLYSLLERFSFLSVRLLKSKFAMIPYFISFISGYPSGALVSDIMVKNNKLSAKEANYILPFTNNCSFQFISAVVAYSMLSDFKLSIFIAVPHFVGALILSFFMTNSLPSSGGKFSGASKACGFNEIFSSSISKSILSILTVGGVIVIFSVFSSYITNLLSSMEIFRSIPSELAAVLSSLLVGALEMTNGCNMIASSVLPVGVKLIIINFLVSFSGMSIIFQTIAVTSDFDMKLADYVKGKFLLGIISAVICTVMLIVLK